MTLKLHFSMFKVRVQKDGFPPYLVSLSLSHTAEKSKVITCLLFAVYYNKKGKERPITATVN